MSFHTEPSVSALRAEAEVNRARLTGTSRVKAQAADIASTTVDKVTETAERTLEAVQQEAAAQGLTPKGAREGAAAVGAKLKTVAKTARDQASKAQPT